MQAAERLRFYEVCKSRQSLNFEVHKKKNLAPFLDLLINLLNLMYFLLVFSIIFFTYIKMSKDSSAKYYQKNKKTTKKGL